MSQAFCRGPTPISSGWLKHVIYCSISAILLSCLDEHQFSHLFRKVCLPMVRFPVVKIIFFKWYRPIRLGLQRAPLHRGVHTL